MNTNFEQWCKFWENGIPEPYNGIEADSWPQYSVMVRLPEIGERLLKENSFQPEIETRIRRLIDQIPYGKIDYLPNSDAADIEEWNEEIRTYTACNWLETPWFFVEFYFYRRIMEAIGYFDQGRYFHYDPFQYQKTMGFNQSMDMISTFLKKVEKPAQNHSERVERFSELIRFNLLGNQLDLSLWPVQDEGSSKTAPSEISTEKFVVDDVQKFVGWFFNHPRERVDFLIDNAGFELLSDLCLADFLLREMSVRKVVFHIKPYPMFVSDVLEKDIFHALKLLDENVGKDKSLAALSQRLRKAIEKDGIEIKSDTFWGLPSPMWNAPERVFQELNRSDLIISKGDANYRRLLGDRQWDYSTELRLAAGYLPSALLVLRIIKSNAGAGYPDEKINAIMREDPDWMKNGEWGSIQFWDGKHPDTA